MASPCVQFSVALKLRAASTRGESTASRSGVERGSTGGRRTRIVVRAASSIPDGVSMTRNGKKRVVITGLGVVTAHGNDVDDFYAKLLAGESAISPITEWTPHTDQGTVIAGEIKGFDPEEFMTKKMARRVDPFIAYQIVAAKKALQSAGIPFAKGEEMDAVVDKTRAGCLIGSAMGGLHSFTTATENCVKEFNGENPSWIGHKKMNPFCIPFAITNMGSALTAMDLGFMGPNYSISSACASGNFCILNSVDHIRNGEADLMLAGASDAAVLPSGMGGFSAVKALSKRNDDPTAASRPWDKGRDGFVMGEGAGVLVLESLEHALGRGATPIAEVLGGSYSCDAHHMTEPHPDGAGVALAITRALKDSGVDAKDVNYVNAHATSTPAGDMAELRVLQDMFGKNDVFKINSTKGMIGHLLGAASAVEAVACIKAIQLGEVHPNINLEDPEDDVELGLLVGDTSEKLAVDVALSNSFGFGGHNSAVLFGKYVPTVE
jgi:3-oxoacyl-[acyl-carrier-protein] synthase II